MTLSDYFRKDVMCEIMLMSYGMIVGNLAFRKEQ